MLTSTEIEQFIRDGYVKIVDAFPTSIAKEACDILWRDTKCDRDNPSSWTKPVVWLGHYGQEPFVKAANTPVLHEAFNQLVGEGRWQPRVTLGSFPVRFPSSDESRDTGWHVDASFPGDEPNNYFKWRINVRSRGRALSLLFLFSDVGDNDAPTRLRVGSHHDVARLLEPYGEHGLTAMEVAEHLHSTRHCAEVLVAGHAGTVFLCHPFIVHAAQPHRGSAPRFMAQPPLTHEGEFAIDMANETVSPVEAAIRYALHHR